MPPASHPTVSTDAMTTPERVRRQASSEWSNAKANERTSKDTSAKSSQGLQEEDHGVMIPSFLQPLLGLDFVPWLPSDGPEASGLPTTPRRRTPILKSSRSESRLDSFASPAEETFYTPPSTFYRSQSDLTDILTSVKLDDIAGPMLSPPTSSSGKDKTRRRSSIKKALTKTIPRGLRRKGATPEKDSATAAVHKRQSSWNSESQTITNDTTTISPSTEWFQQQQVLLQSQSRHLENVQSEAQEMQTRTVQIQDRIGDLRQHMQTLQDALMQTQAKLDQEVSDLGLAQSQLDQLEQKAIDAAQAASITIENLRNGAKLSHQGEKDPNKKMDPGVVSPNRKRSLTAPARSSSFMRIHDLELDYTTATSESTDSLLLDSASSTSSSSLAAEKGNNNPDFFYIDHDVVHVLEKLFQLGLSVVRDETERFVPSKDTLKLLSKPPYTTDSRSPGENGDAKWQVVHGTDVLVWIGGVPHTGFGHNWPVVKSRGIVQCPPRNLIEYLLDSSKVKEYNNISLGREDFLVIQKGFETTKEESDFGLAGDVKIIKSLNKPRMLPKSIELVSLMYSQHLSDEPGSYLTVSRSVFEDDSGEHKASIKNTIRSEMLLGVHLMRPHNNGTETELTVVNHIYAPGVPEMLAKRAAPTQAAGFIRDIQAIFKK